MNQGTRGGVDKAIIFGVNAKYFGQKLAAKNEKKFIIIKRKNGIHSVKRDEVPES